MMWKIRIAALLLFIGGCWADFILKEQARVLYWSVTPVGYGDEGPRLFPPTQAERASEEKRDRALERVAAMDRWGVVLALTGCFSGLAGVVVEVGYQAGKLFFRGRRRP